MESKELILIYGLPASKEEGDKVQTVLRDEGISFREVLPQELGLEVGVLAGLDNADSCPPMVEPFSQCAMVFCGFSEQRLRDTLSLLREAGAGNNSLKAILTPNNRDWRFCDLLEELQKERQELARIMKAKAEVEKKAT